MTDPAPPRKPPKPVTAAYLERAALHYLERYASSAGNLRRVLARKVERRCRERDEDPAEFLPLVDEVVGKAVSGGYLDDRLYAEGRVAALRRRGASARGIAAKLSAKGVDRDTVAAALGAEEGDDMTAALALARRRRLGPFRTRDREGHRDRDLAVLARGGFPFDVARKVVDGDGTGEE
ncbi:MAG TPA: RecX family transcriptional regulator [Salinarimonas sp.]|nr:RecX family transcriptional regulator [Salinarimonas sp.]